MAALKMDLRIGLVEAAVSLCYIIRLIDMQHIYNQNYRLFQTLYQVVPRGNPNQINIPE